VKNVLCSFGPFFAFPEDSGGLSLPLFSLSGSGSECGNDGDQPLHHQFYRGVAEMGADVSQKYLADLIVAVSHIVFIKVDPKWDRSRSRPARSVNERQYK
jgi:hypothetical protein